jgi:AraC-like DNA-binding protein
MTDIFHVKSVAQLHKALGLKSPLHPLATVIRYDENLDISLLKQGTYVLDLYQVSLKPVVGCEIIYGRNSYDYQEGTLIFTQPGQAISFTAQPSSSTGTGWALLFHPDLIRRAPLGKRINEFHFFSYDTHEALHLSQREEENLSLQVANIEEELGLNIDKHSQGLMISNIELTLDYCMRYYDRQFYVRANMNQDLVSKFENLLNQYFHESNNLEHGLPTVAWCAAKLNMSPHYLGDMLRKETGKTTQQHIQHYVIEMAKNQLLNSNDKVGVIAYNLGFEYPQHFSKLFKAVTGMSPVEYRKIN